MGKKQCSVASNIFFQPKKNKEIRPPSKPDPDRQFKLSKIGKEKSVEVSFPKMMGSNLKISVAIPNFRNDGLFFTPAFSLPDEMNKSFEEQNWANFAKWVDSSQQKSSLGELAPKSHKNFCTVCKERYEEYQSHINEESHLNKWKTSQFLPDIWNLCRKYGGQYMMEEEFPCEHKLEQDKEMKGMESTSSGSSLQIYGEKKHSTREDWSPDQQQFQQIF